MQSWIRIWTHKNLDEITKHLLIVGDVKGDCASCREIGLDYKTIRQCPNCQTTFQFITSRRFESNPGERFSIVKRLSQSRSDLVWIDYDDYRLLTGRQRARDFFKD